MATQPKETVIQVPEIQTQTVRIGVRGTRPLILNRMSEKAKRELMFPKGRKTSAEKNTTLKHLPLQEYQASAYTIPDEDPDGSSATLLGIPSSCFKNAMMTAALDLPGAQRTKVGRLLWVEGDLTPIYGIPKIFLAVTRSADMNKTPDIRVRSIVPEWAAIVTISYVVPLISETAVVNLLSGAGIMSGVGDWRPEKGKGTFGQFVLTNPDDDPAFSRILAEGGRAAQAAALESPEPHDRESEELLDWFSETVVSRGKASLLNGVSS